VLVAFGRAARRRALRPGWWAAVLPAYVAGLFLGLIVAPFAGLDVEAGVFMALLIGPLALIVLVWIALWTALMVARSRPRRAPDAGDGGRAVVVTAS
jgi:ABC-type uncharacterized transport system permease subunit